MGDLGGFFNIRAIRHTSVMELGFGILFVLDLGEHKDKEKQLLLCFLFKERTRSS